VQIAALIFCAILFLRQTTGKEHLMSAIASSPAAGVRIAL
jgi:hypothetical protein